MCFFRAQVNDIDENQMAASYSERCSAPVHHRVEHKALVF